MDWDSVLMHGLSNGGWVMICVGLGYNSEVWTEALQSSIMLRHGLRLRSEAWTEAEVWSIDWGRGLRYGLKFWLPHTASLSTSYFKPTSCHLNSYLTYLCHTSTYSIQWRSHYHFQISCYILSHSHLSLKALLMILKLTWYLRLE